MITLIAAVDTCMGIGNGKTILWDEPEDQKFFRQETLGGAVIMGRKTWNSLRRTALPNRLNIIVSTQYYFNLNNDNTYYAESIEQALKYAKSQSTRIYGIGGAGIYEELLEHANRLLLTRIKGNYNCKVKFPHFREMDWTKSTYTINNLNIDEYLRYELTTKEN